MGLARSLAWPMIAVARAPLDLLSSFVGVEEPAMLENGVAVSHTSDVIRHRASPAGRSFCRLGSDGHIPMFRRHETHILEERTEQRFENTPRLRVHPQHLVVFVKVVAQEFHELDMLRPGRLAQSDQRLGEAADVEVRKRRMTEREGRQEA